jgi:quinol-cytochrome oxidoreductase complex cytochrome b subunit
LIIVFLHLLRVVFTGAYRPPRHASWIFGILLLLLVVVSNFTGYLLPWDQLSFWAVTVITSLFQYIPLIGEPIKSLLIGGNEVGAETLSNFFNLHTGIIPLLMVLFMAYHFWRIRRAGGVIVSEANKGGPVVETQPHLVARELVVALALVAFLLLFSVLFDAPLRERASPTISPNPAKAPWYFMGLQELLIHFHPFFAVVVFPLVLLTGSIYLPFLRLKEFNQGVWFLSEKGKKSAIHSAISGGIFTVFFVLISEILPDPQTIVAFIPAIITSGLLPFLIVVGTIWLYLKYFKKKFGLNRSEIVQTLIVLLVVSYLVLSIIGMLFRVEGMALGW